MDIKNLYNNWKLTQSIKIYPIQLDISIPENNLMKELACNVDSFNRHYDSFLKDNYGYLWLVGQKMNKYINYTITM
jgi:hypothetical protein